MPWNYASVIVHLRARRMDIDRINKCFYYDHVLLHLLSSRTKRIILFIHQGVGDDVQDSVFESGIHTLILQLRFLLLHFIPVQSFPLAKATIFADIFIVSVQGNFGRVYSVDV